MRLDRRPLMPPPYLFRPLRSWISTGACAPLVFPVLLVHLELRLLHRLEILALVELLLPRRLDFRRDRWDLHCNGSARSAPCPLGALLPSSRPSAFVAPPSYRVSFRQRPRGIFRPHVIHSVFSR